KYAHDLNEYVTVKNDLSYVEPTSMYLKVGEKFTVEELLQSLMLNSSNDVAVLLAEYISGSVESFAELMNKEAKKIGCENTNFVNPNGLPDENHYTTAYDIALMSSEAMKNDKLREIVQLEYVKFYSNKIYNFDRVYRNSNKFISGKGTIEYKGEYINPKYDIVTGLKTGYTRAAGRCLLATAEKDGMEIVSGVFKSQGDLVYTDSRTLIDYTYDNFQNNVILSKDDFSINKRIYFYKEKYVEGVIKDDYIVTVPKNEKLDNYSYEVKLNDKLNTPIQKDDIIGKVEILKNKEIIDTIDIYASQSIDSVFSINNKIIVVLAIWIIIFAIVFMLLRKKKNIKRIKVKKLKNTKNNIKLK
ncbi:MAG: D-alanyl-D-alanine carboxypeptidase, partial [Romboutsia sp.]|nr:D-alanyl-D-alanine carboxypeptidase [Romboutsia sp.]